MIRIYTRKGDDGFTHLWYGGRVAKSDGRPEAYGSVDEAGSAARALSCGGPGQSRAASGAAAYAERPVVARLDAARATMRRAERRAERRVVDLKVAGVIADDTVLRYPNRVSDAVWAMARYADEPEPEVFEGRG